MTGLSSLSSSSSSSSSPQRFISLAWHARCWSDAGIRLACLLPRASDLVHPWPWMLISRHAGCCADAGQDRNFASKNRRRAGEGSSSPSVGLGRSLPHGMMIPSPAACDRDRGLLKNRVCDKIAKQMEEYWLAGPGQPAS